MIGYFDVYYEGRLIATRIRAFSREGAIEQAYMKTGSASAYTGNARRLYKAVRV